MSEQDQQRYRDLLHAVQSGVAMKMNYDGGPERGETSPKHLRVGVNSALVTAGVVVGLLIGKGVITEDEFHAALADGAEHEKNLYETWLHERLGAHVHLA